MFNKLAHYLIGFFCGLFAHKPASRTATIAFVGYQTIEQRSKGDKGYPEVREWAVGFGIGITCRALHRNRHNLRSYYRNGGIRKAIKDAGQYLKQEA